MIGVTVREALNLDELRDVRVLAGGAGLERNINCVNVMEVPDIVQWVRGEELLVTTTYPLKDSPISLRDLIVQLDQKRLAGIAIKPQRYLDQIPGEMLSVADELGFPVLELPPGTSFVDIITAILTRILNAQAEWLKRSAEIHERFTNVVLEGGGLAEIADLLASILHKPVLILGGDGEMLARAGQGAGEAPPVKGRLSRPGGRARGRADSSPRPPLWQGGALRRSIAGGDGGTPVLWRAIKSGGLDFGEIVVSETNGPVAEADLPAVEHAGTVAALAFSKLRAVGEVELRFRNDFLNDLLSGNIADRAVLQARAEALGLDIGRPFKVIVAEIRALEAEQGVEEGAAVAIEAARRIGRLFAETARRLDPASITWGRTDSVIVLCPADARADAQAARKRATWLAGQLQQQVALEEGLALTWGVGGFYHDVLDLCRAYDEARRAAAIGRSTAAPGALNHYEDMGVYRLLYQFPDPLRVREFAREVLEPLLLHDSRHAGRLIDTLEAYLSCDQNVALTARELGLHYNTVKSRLQRADELLAGALQNSHRRLELELAIKALRLHGA